METNVNSSQLFTDNNYLFICFLPNSPFAKRTFQTSLVVPLPSHHDPLYPLARYNICLPKVLRVPVSLSLEKSTFTSGAFILKSKLHLYHFSAQQSSIEIYQMILKKILILRKERRCNLIDKNSDILKTLFLYAYNSYWRLIFVSSRTSVSFLKKWQPKSLRLVEGCL